jgi:hypothetical protein
LEVLCLAWEWNMNAYLLVQVALYINIRPSLPPSTFFCSLGHETNHSHNTYLPPCISSHEHITTSVSKILVDDETSSQHTYTIYIQARCISAHFSHHSSRMKNASATPPTLLTYAYHLVHHTTNTPSRECETYAFVTHPSASQTLHVTWPNEA